MFNSKCFALFLVGSLDRDYVYLVVL